uniref:EamA domain-containing protein n=1 Tax=Guillardia theta TaxID=55529 RepID=A0A7S4PAL4_GUITH|mmetsp:Transcript_46258/g.145093  ORF Transcript_46258/g.145093 Transcript_46258/m.145093 type:complete len:441 (+) Transcript_46258:204-1526(+)
MRTRNPALKSASRCRKGSQSFKPLRQLSVEFAEAIAVNQGFDTVATSETWDVKSSENELHSKMSSESELKSPPKSGLFSSISNQISFALVAVTAASFYQVRLSSGASTKTTSSVKDQNYAMGLALAGVALIGNAAVGAFRKILSQHNIGSAQQVGIATLLQGIVSIIYCFNSGDLKFGSVQEMTDALPPRAFWIAAVSASVLNSIVKTLETKAFAESDISLCAPFLAFDPVMQFLVGVAVMPLACKMIEFGCDEAKTSYPPYHILSVGCIAYGAFLLGKGIAPKGSSGNVKEAKMLGPLPLGSWFILINCVIYGFTSRLDKVAIKSAGKTLYYAYGRLLMASTTLGGSFMSGGLTFRELKKFMAPPVLLLIFAICLSDAIYMLSLYQAFAWISPVYVTAIKRGGGILLSSLLGVLLFSESVAGRFVPIVTICSGVTFLCL